MQVFEGKIVYCVELGHPLYGRRLKIESITDEREILFTEMQTGKVVEITLEQTRESMPQHPDTTGSM